MLESNGVWIGSRDTDGFGSIPDVAVAMPSLLGSLEYVLITAIDSATELSSPALPADIWWRETRGLPLFSHGKALRTTGRIFLKIIEQGVLFTGFDEVWFLHSLPPAEALEGLCICAERWADDPSFRPRAGYMSLPEVAAWMKESGAVLGLADGMGLHYITTQEDIASALEID